MPGARQARRPRTSSEAVSALATASINVAGSPVTDLAARLQYHDIDAELAATPPAPAEADAPVPAAAASHQAGDDASRKLARMRSAPDVPEPRAGSLLGRTRRRPSPSARARNARKVVGRSSEYNHEALAQQAFATSMSLRIELRGRAIASAEAAGAAWEELKAAVADGAALGRELLGAAARMDERPFTLYQALLRGARAAGVDGDDQVMASPPLVRRSPGSVRAGCSDGGERVPARVLAAFGIDPSDDLAVARACRRVVALKRAVRLKLEDDNDLRLALAALEEAAAFLDDVRAAAAAENIDPSAVLARLLAGVTPSQRYES